jgi:hypothetical protein
LPPLAAQPASVSIAHAPSVQQAPIGGVHGLHMEPSPWYSPPAAAHSPGELIVHVAPMQHAPVGDPTSSKRAGR